MSRSCSSSSAYSGRNVDEHDQDNNEPSQTPPNAQTPSPQKPKVARSTSQITGLPRGEELLKALCLWPGYDATKSIGPSKMADQYGCDRTTITKAINRALDVCFGSDSSSAYRQLQKRHFPPLEGKDGNGFDAAGAVGLIMVYGGELAVKLGEMENMSLEEAWEVSVEFRKRETGGNKELAEKQLMEELEEVMGLT